MTGKNNSTYWIWYPGDFELYYGMKQNFSRIERGYGWPAFWKSEGYRNRIVLKKQYDLSSETTFQVHSEAIGYVLLNSSSGEQKYRFGTEITCGPGRVSVSVHLARIDAFPSAYIEGEQIFSDASWMAEDYSSKPVHAGCCKYFISRTQSPEDWKFSEREYMPVLELEQNGGVLYEFETELTAAIEVKAVDPAASLENVHVCYGESKEEALDTVNCYFSSTPDLKNGRCETNAVRFAYIPNCQKGMYQVKAIYQYVDIPVRASFHSSDSLLNQIWKVSEHTFRLCSGIFFIDGIKRDKWIWSGDAYQSYLINRYLMADPDINRRTMLALRGNDQMTTHINTIIDYSLYWILGIREQYVSYGDLAFLEYIYPKMRSLMEFCCEQTDEHGFFIGRAGDWVFVDWSDMEKDGAVCAEQMLYAQALKTMQEVGGVLGENVGRYAELYDSLCKNIEEYFWDQEKRAYIDSFQSGNRNVTRHGNIFAVLFDIADTERKQQILENVLFNDSVLQITTPYFKFFEMEALCKLGCHETVLARMKEYWGGMLQRGAVTFWEEYDPSVPEALQYDMYGDRFGKSLCHAWGASPVYLLARYFIGLEITDPFTEGYTINPHLEAFETLECDLPVGKKTVHVSWDRRKGMEYWER